MEQFLKIPGWLDYKGGIIQPSYLWILWGLPLILIKLFNKPFLRILMKINQHIYIYTHIMESVSSPPTHQAASAQHEAAFSAPISKVLVAALALGLRRSWSWRNVVSRYESCWLSTVPRLGPPRERRKRKRQAAKRLTAIQGRVGGGWGRLDF